ncbi:MAG: hypothetical protein AB1742_05285 [bacterium]
MQSVFQSGMDWVREGIIVFGAGWLVLAGINLLLKRKARLAAGCVVGAALSVADMLLMHFLWHVPFCADSPLYFLIGFFGYGSWILIFKVEDMGYNGKISFIGLTAMITTYFENIVVGGLGAGRMTYPVPYWSFPVTFIYFGAMFAIGTLIYLLAYKKLSGDESVKILEL